MEKKYITNSIEETWAIGRMLAKQLDRNTICLYGDLGAGKTSLTQGIASQFGITRVTSPSFLILKEYPIHGTNLPFERLFHLDFYRLNSQDEIKAFDLEEIVNNPKNLVIIEWPEKIPNVLPKNRIDIFLSEQNDSHVIKIKAK